MSLPPADEVTMQASGDKDEGDTSRTTENDLSSHSASIADQERTASEPDTVAPSLPVPEPAVEKAAALAEAPIEDKQQTNDDESSQDKAPASDAPAKQGWGWGWGWAKSLVGY